MSTPSIGWSIPSARTGMWVPLSASALLFFNAGMIWIGFYTHYPISSSLVAGSLDGIVFSVVATTLFSERLQGCGTGVLSSLSMDRITNGGTFLRTLADGIHRILDVVLAPFQTLPELVHQEVEQAILRVTWIAIAIVLISLVSTWLAELASALKPATVQSGRSAGRNN